MTLPANDTLIAGSTETIDVYSSNWTQMVAGNKYYVATTGGIGVSDAGSSTVGAYWNADVFPNDQYSQATNALFTSIARDIQNGLIVRASTAGGQNGYVFLIDINSSVWKVAKFVNGTFTSFSGDVAGTFNINDVYKLTVAGAQITAYQNGTLLYTTTDSTLASGSAGLYGFGNATGGTSQFALKNWQGGAIALQPGATWLSNLSPSLVSPSGPLQFWSNPGSGIGLQPGGFPFPVSNGPNTGGAKPGYRRGQSRSVRNPSGF